MKKRNARMMSIETENVIMGYYNNGYTIREIEMKDNIFYGFCAIQCAIARNKDKITFLNSKDITKIFNLRSLYSTWDFIHKSGMSFIRGSDESKDNLIKRIRDIIMMSKYYLNM